MLKELHIRNIILIEEAELTFSRGFNVISGETGAGKSALTSALSLLLGGRADGSLIRKGCSEASVEAVFVNGLHVRREITSAGRGRCAINGQNASLRELRDATAGIVDLVGQHANQQLRTSESHRDLLDLFGEVNFKAYKESWSQQVQYHSELSELVQHESLYLRERDRLAHEIAEIEQVQPGEDEDDQLFEEYSSLTKNQDQLKALLSVNDALDQLLARAQIQRGAVDRVATSECAALYKQAVAEIEEVAYTLRTRQAELEFDPERFEEIDARLTAITRLKRKYGKTVAEINAYAEQARVRMDTLDGYDFRREELRKLHAAAVLATEAAAAALTQARTEAAGRLAEQMTALLRDLNMPHAEFTVAVQPQARSSHGDEQIEFFLAPNRGEEAVSVASKVSGGELARVMIAIKALLAGKEEVGTLVFDEIDANIGGETATLIGARLQEMGQHRQVVCITHFPQVASFAERHLQVYKQEIDGRTVSVVRVLDGKDRPEEIARMAGGKKKVRI